MPTLNAPWGTDADIVDAVPKLFSKNGSEDKENVLAKMPSIFGKEGEGSQGRSKLATLTLRCATLQAVIGRTSPAHLVRRATSASLKTCRK